MPFSDEVVIGTGTRIDIAQIVPGQRAPAQFVLTVGTAGTQGATTLQMSADNEFKVADGERIDFADGTHCIVAIPTGSNPEDLFTIGTTATAVPVQPLASAVTSGTTAVTKFQDMSFATKAVANLPYVYQMRRVLGLTEASPTPTSEVVNATSMSSGFGAATAVVGIDMQITATMNQTKQHRAYHEIIGLKVHDTGGEDLQSLIWVRFLGSDGTRYEGPSRVSVSGSSSANRAVSTLSLTFTMEGENWSYISGDEEFFAAA